jgi:hypothetical protein
LTFYGLIKIAAHPKRRETKDPEAAKKTSTTPTRVVEGDKGNMKIFSAEQGCALSTQAYWSVRVFLTIFSL